MCAFETSSVVPKANEVAATQTPLYRCVRYGEEDGNRADERKTSVVRKPFWMDSIQSGLEKGGIVNLSVRGRLYSLWMRWQSVLNSRQRKNASSEHIEHIDRGVYEYLV